MLLVNKQGKFFINRDYSILLILKQGKIYPLDIANYLLAI